MRWYSGSSQAEERSNWGAYGARFNFRSNSMFHATISIPNGYGMQAWTPPMVAGGMSANTSISGEGEVGSADVAGGLNGAADLEGSGTITLAALGLISSAVAALTGAGVISGNISGVLQAAADLLGQGDITAALGALAGLTSSLSGDGTLSASVSGPANMTAHIVVTGDVLNTANVAEAVWSALVESSYSYEDAIKILLAVAAGKTNIVDLGGGAATVTFRDLADTLDRVTADMLGSERDSVAYDLSD